jgi:hypothetical protein
VESNAVVVSACNANCTTLIMTSCIVQHHIQNLTYVILAPIVMCIVPEAPTLYIVSCREQALAVCGVQHGCRERLQCNLHHTDGQLHCPSPYAEPQLCSLGPPFFIVPGSLIMDLVSCIYIEPLQFLESDALVARARNATAVCGVRRNSTTLMTNFFV